MKNSSPLFKEAEPHEPSSPFTSCWTSSLLLHFTVVPTLTVTAAGVKAKSSISISASPESAGPAGVVSIVETGIGASVEVELGTWLETAGRVLSTDWRQCPGWCWTGFQTTGGK